MQELCPPYHEPGFLHYFFNSDDKPTVPNLPDILFAYTHSGKYRISWNMHMMTPVEIVDRLEML